MNPKEVFVNVEEIRRYGVAVQALENGEMDADRFMALRLQHGIYGQRQEGVQMVRIKVPGGRLNRAQIAAVADALSNYSSDKFVSVTTRQDFQLHFVDLNTTPALMSDLGKVGLTTREACGNTVRNITACPMAGVCPREHTDVSTFVDGAVTRFLRNPLTQHLPRKFKISFSGCEADCALGLMHDVGVVAIKHGDRFGFKVLAGGGLGHKPRAAIVVEEFINEAELLPCMEALIALHNRFSDRKRRAKARIKFLVEKFGPNGFLDKYRQELGRARGAFANLPTPKGSWRDQTGGEVCGAGAPRRVLPQRQPGLHSLPINLPLGQISAEQLRAIARIVDQDSLDDIRTTVDQSVIITNIPTARIKAIRAALRDIDLYEPAVGDNVVACPGTSTCRLGITSSKHIARELSGTHADLRIRVSGCHNSCGQHHIGDIGLHGEGQRLHGKLIPSYVMHFGGDGMFGGAVALKGPTVPSARIEAAVTRVQHAYLADRASDETFTQWSRRKDSAYFSDMLADLVEVNSVDIASVSRDHGEKEAFKVLQLGGGECAGAAQDRVVSSFSEAMHEKIYRDAFALQRNYHDALDCARQMIQLVGESVVFLAGHKTAGDLPAMADTLQKALSEQALGVQLAALHATLGRLEKRFELAVYAQWTKDLDQWVDFAARVCQTIDKQLDLGTALPERGDAVDEPPEVDLTSYECPLHYIKARNELRKMEAGKIATFVFVSGEPTHTVAASLKTDGHDIIAKEISGDTTRLTVRKAGPVAQAS